MKERTPFGVHAHIDRLPPTIAITLVNKTKDLPLRVKAVRIHHGLKDYSYSFTLVTGDGDRANDIAPKDSAEFCLPFDRTIVSKHYLSKEPPKSDKGTAGPGFDSPADLFKAIARSPEKSSWVEIDFNEFRRRRVLRGKMKSLFQAIIDMGPPPRTENERQG
jgi:hypothetical protein